MRSRESRFWHQRLGWPPGQFPSDIAIDQTTGHLYVHNAERIEAYSATGQFLRAWGQDVVASGPDDSVGPNEQKSVTVTADGGYLHTWLPSARHPPTESTGPTPFDASPAAVEAALDGLKEIGGNYSSVSVTGGPGDLAGTSPYLLTFHGLLGGDDLDDALTANPNGLTVSSGSKSSTSKR